MPVFNNALAGAAGSGGASGYKIERSLRFDSDDSSHLTKVFGGADRKKWTLSFWYKPALQNTNHRRQIFTAKNGSVDSIMNFRDSDDSFEMYHYNGSGLSFQICSTASFRDPSAWYHFVVAWDTTQATNTDRVKVWCNGERITQWKIANWPGHNTDYVLWNDNNVTHRIGTDSSHYLSGYLAEMHFIDSIVKDETAFGEYDSKGVWQPIEYTGIYNSTSAPLGVNGFHLDFSDNSSNAALGFDANVSGTRYSAYVTGFGSPGPANMFDGDATTSYAVSATGGRMTFTPPTAIPYTDASGGVEVKFMASASGQLDRVRINGGSWVTQPSGGGWHKVSTGNGSITSMDFEDEGTQEAVIHAIRVNGTILTDPSGANDWTVVNVSTQATTHAVAGTHSGKPGISFNGTNAEINLSSDADLNPGSGEFTLECYAYAASGGSAEFGIYDGSPGGTGSLVLRRVGAGTLMVERHNQAFDITGASFSENTWHHVAVTRDSSNNVKLFVDGTQSGSTSTNNTHNYQGLFRLGRTNNGFTNGYISSLRLIKGHCLYTSNFTPPSGTLGDYQTTTLLMAQSTTSVTEATVKPSGVTITASGDSTGIDSLIDTPTDYESENGNHGGNYATWNSVHHETIPKSYSLSNGNLVATFPGSTAQASGQRGFAFSTLGMSSGKWYFELTGGSLHNEDHAVGIALGDADGYYAPTNSWTYRGNGSRWVTGDAGGSYGASWGEGDVIGVAFDRDAGTLTMYKNGTSQGALISNLRSPTNQPYFFVWGCDSGGSYSWTVNANFGQRPFDYTPPTGYKALCTTNLDDPLIEKPEEHFDTTLWTGNGQSMDVGGPIYSATSTMSSATQAFNGDESNGAVFSNASVLTAASITITSSLEIYHNRTGSSGITVNINGTDYTATGLSSAGYHTIPIPAGNLPLTSTGNITVTDNDGSSTLYAVRVDGSVLIDGNGDPLNFSPDLTWIKNRSTNSTDHILGNSLVPGAHLYSNGNWTEGSGRITSLNSNGFTVSNHDTVNDTNDEYISWNWNGGDLATNSTYDQSKVWSSFWSATGNGIEAANPARNSFDGVLTGLGMRLNASSSCTWAPTGGYSYSGDFLIYACKDNDYTGTSWTVVHAGGTTDITSSVASGTTMTELNLTNLGIQSPITSISFTSNNNGNPRVAGMKANGKILVDTGVVPIGSLNSTVYNTSQNWSVSGSNMQNDWSASFDGDTDPHFALPNTGYSASMTFPSAISYQTLELVVCRDIYAPDLLVNGNKLNVPATDTNNTGGRYKIERYYFTNGTLTSIGHETRNTAGRGGSGFWQIIVDGKILVDTNQASNAPNVPSIATTCTSNPTAGFAISTYKGNDTDGASIATNLGSTPEMVITKPRNNSDDWRVYHVGAGNPYYLRLQLNNGRNSTNNWREMSLNYFAVDTDSAINSSNYNYLAYSFSSVEGYSLVSSYQGQNRFVYCGFRPRFLLIKSATTTEHWAIYDTERSRFNHADDVIKANSSDDEDFNYGSGEIDILSNGFKLRGNWGAINHSSAPTYVFLAIAEKPFKYARAR